MVVKMQDIAIYEKFDLNSPYLLAGFEGWLDAGKVSTGGSRILEGQVGSQEIRRD
jgi:hypothetical protein